MKERADPALPSPPPQPGPSATAPSSPCRGAPKRPRGDVLFRNLLATRVLKKRALYGWAAGLAVVGLFLLLYRALDITQAWAFSDLSPWFSEPGVFFRRALHLWVDEGIGYPSSGIAFDVTRGTLAFIFGGCAQRVYFLALLPAALLAFRFVAVRLGINRWAALGAGLLYALNPVSISEFANGSAGVLAVYAVAPVMAYYIIKMVSAKRVSLRDFVVVGALAFVLSFNAHTAFWLVALPGISALVVWRPPVRQMLARCSLILLAGAPLLAVEAVGYSHYYARVTSPGWSALGDFTWCYADVSVLRLLRLAGNKGTAQALLGYNRASWYSFLGFVFPVISALSLPWRGRRKEGSRGSLVAFCLLTLVMSLGLILFVQHNTNTASASLLLLTVRNPSKLMFVMALSLSFLYGMGLDRLRDRCRHKGVLIAVFGLVLVAHLLYLWPAADGTLGIRTFYRGGSYYTPRYYSSELPEEIASSATPSYVLLPWEYPGVLRMRPLAPQFFGVTVGMLASAGDLPLVYESLGLGARGIGDVLSQLGVRHVMVDKEYETYKAVPEGPFSQYTSYGSPFLAGDPGCFVRTLEESGDFVLTENGPCFAVFDVRPAASAGGTVSEAKFLRLLAIEKQLGPSLLREEQVPISGGSWSSWPKDRVFFVGDWIALLTQPDYYTNVSQDVGVEEGRIFRFSFGVRLSALSGAHAKVVWFSSSRSESGGEAQRTLGTDFVTLGDHGVQEGRWCDVSADLMAPRGATSARVSLFGNRGSPEQPGSALVLYAQVAFCPVVGATLLTEENPEFGTVESVTSVKAAPTRYEVDLSSTGPYVLALTQTYDPGWNAIAPDGQRYASQPLMGFLNSFEVHGEGPQHLSIVYAPQRTYYWLAIGVLTWTAVIMGFEVFAVFEYSMRRWRGAAKGPSKDSG